MTSESEVVEQYPTPAAEIPKPSSETREKAKADLAETKERVKSKVAETKARSKEVVHKAEAEGFYLWELLKEQLFRPGVAGGLIGVVVRPQRLCVAVPECSRVPPEHWTYRRCWVHILRATAPPSRCQGH